MLKYGESRGIKVNKSHAAAYATISYMTAWLKYHYPAEYMCSVMSRTNSQKLPKLVNSCRKMGLRIMPPNINLSQDSFVNDGNVILYGFGCVKNIASAGSAIVAERDAHGPFLSVKDFVCRMLSNSSNGYSKDIMENLIKAGAFDQFCGGNRASILTSIEEFSATTKSMLDKGQKLTAREKTLEKLKAEKAAAADIKKAERSVANAQKSYDAAKELYAQHSFVLVPENQGEKLDAEYELLGAYLSSNPFSEYSEAAKRVENRVDIADAYSKNEREYITVCGIIKELRMLQRNKDGRPFCVFNLFDESGDIEVKCFTEKYAKYASIINEKTAVTIVARVSVDRRTDDDGNETSASMNLSVYSMEVLKRNTNERIILAGSTVLDYVNNESAIKAYASPSGYTAYWQDAFDRQLRTLDFLLSKDILSAKLHGITVSISKT